MRKFAPTFYVCAAVVPAVLLFASSARAQDGLPSADEIVNKHVEARGGLEKIKAIQSLKLTGNAVLGGGQMEAPFTLLTKRPNEMHMEISMQGKSLIQAFDGNTAWMQNPFTGGTDPQKSPEDETKAMTEFADFDGALVDYKSKGNTVEVVGKEDVQGSPTFKLKVTQKGGHVGYYFISAKTYMPVKVTTTRKQMGQEMEIDSYPGNFKLVNGVMTPFSMEQKVGGSTMMQMTVEKAEANVAIDEAVFKFPGKPEAPASAGVTGTWAGKFDVQITDGQSMQGKVSLILTQKGSELTGTASSPEGALKILNGKVDGNKITFQVQTEGPKMAFDLHLEDEHMRGTAKGDSDGNTVNVKLDLTRN